MQEPPPEPPEQPTQPLPVPQVPQMPQLLQTPQGPTRRRQYFIGMAWGCIPLVLSLIGGGLFGNGYGGSSLNIAIFLLLGAVIGYLALIVVTIVNLVKKERRFIGYGMLTLVLITPVASVYGCQVITYNLHL